MRRVVLAALLGLLALAVPALAEAQVVAHISLSTQRMNVSVDGVRSIAGRCRRRGPVTGHGPARSSRPRCSAITLRPSIAARLCPYSIFFLRGYAIHGSYEIKYLGRPASHGCVRLHPSNAAALYSLVRTHGRANTVIRISY